MFYKLLQKPGLRTPEVDVTAVVRKPSPVSFIERRAMRQVGARRPSLTTRCRTSEPQPVHGEARLSRDRAR
jgi:hypothetical protein